MFVIFEDSGMTYRMNTATGETCALVNGTWLPVKEPRA
jgi:hypothetical protein